MKRRRYRLGPFVEIVKWPGKTSRGVVHVLENVRRADLTWCGRPSRTWWHRIRADWKPRRHEVCKRCLAKQGQRVLELASPDEERRSIAPPLVG